MFSFFRTYLFQQIDRFNDRNQAIPFWLRFFINRDEKLQEYWRDLKDLESLLMFHRLDYLNSKTIVDESEQNHLKSKPKTPVSQNSFLRTPSINRSRTLNNSLHESKEKSRPYSLSKTFLKKNRYTKWLTTAVSIILLAGICFFLFYSSSSDFPQQGRQQDSFLLTNIPSPQISLKLNWNNISPEELKQYFPLFVLSPVETTYFLMKTKTENQSETSTIGLFDSTDNKSDSPKSTESRENNQINLDANNQNESFYLSILNRVIESNSFSSYFAQLYSSDKQ
ncbi:MAG: hypothetical protein Q4C95_07765 [Planctomycetia bacterium]|nr:hypothetical protein [Planctomycetia bacterium]